MATVSVTDATFDAEVRQADIPVVVDFWAEWCGPCKQIGPALEELSAEFEGKVKIVKVNVDENPNSPAQLGVRGIPALFMFRDGEVVSNKTGAAPKGSIAKLDRRISLNRQKRFPGRFGAPFRSNIPAPCAHRCQNFVFGIRTPGIDRHLL